MPYSRVTISWKTASGRLRSNSALEGLLFVAFVALSILGRLRASLKGVPPVRAARAAGCEALDFDTAGALDDCATLSGALHELHGISATADRHGGVRIANLSERKHRLATCMGFEDLFDSAQGVWELLSARRLSETIAALKAADSGPR